AERGLHEGDLGRKVRVERLLAHAEFLGQVVHGHAAEPVREEMSAGFRDDPPPRLVLLNRRFAHGQCHQSSLQVNRGNYFSLSGFLAIGRPNRYKDVMPDIPEPQISVNSRREVVLCDTAGRPTGSTELIPAPPGPRQLPLASSVYVLTPNRQHLIIQQRSADKMLWPLVWANTCCSHPRAGETPVEAGRRRLWEEMRLDCELVPGPGFVYRAEDPAGRGVER